jgi:7,8-dihydropterin-6-yl-methyl-4-(beta-D-ribofuranosyl)aminobenzene 5'-phosphate synthase
MTVTSLVDDYCPKGGLRGEHGLSLFVEYGGARILFDAGQGPAFLENARTLGVDLSRLDAVVLSHGHYDHGSGLRSLYASLGEAAPPLFAGRNFDRSRFSRNMDGLKDIGIPRPILPPGFPPAIIIGAAEELAPGIHLLPSAERVDGKPANARFRLVEDGRDSVDAFDDELSLVFDTPRGMVIIAGCAHRGILNIISAAKLAFPGRALAAIIGGFHFVDAAESELEGLAQSIADCSPELVACSHCTGLKGFSALSRAIPGRTSWLACGMTVEI